MPARTPHPILSTVTRRDVLAWLEEDEHDEVRKRDQLARAAFDTAAERFARTPGPAELVQQIADDRLSHGERTFAAGIAGFGLITLGLMAATVLRHFGIC